MDAKEERELAQRIEQGDENAKSEMVEEHLWLVDWVAKRYYGLKLSFDDLKQEGVIALFKAVKNFDYRKGRFSTHADFWIRQQMTRAIFAESLIKLPIPVHEKIRAGKRNLNSVPTVDFSLDDKIYDDGKSVWQERLVDKKAKPNGDAIEKITREQLKRFLEELLSPAQVFDLWHHFGLANGTNWSCERIAQTRGVSRQAIQSNIQEALKKLRHPSRKKMLKELLEDS